MGSITIIDWRADFIAGLGEHTAALDPSRTLVLFPHNRPARHLRAWYRQADLPLPRMLPDMASFDAFVTGLRRDLSDVALRPAGRLDQISLLLDIVHELRRNEGGLLAKLPPEPDAFFPWGMRLASLLEEFLRQGVTPKNLAHMSGEVAPWGAALLEKLGSIAEAYVRGLEDRGWTTPGLDHRALAGHLDRVAEHLRSTTIVAAGFYALSGMENALFKRLWDEGVLEVFWHSDPELAAGRPGHPDVIEHRRWLRSWNARALLAGPPPRHPRGPAISFVEGFDLHSQIHGLCRLLEHEAHADTAVVLPDTGALLPLLHQLPGGEDDPFNISMGYPLERTSLYQLLDTLLGLQEHRDARGGYHRRDLLALLRHPYLKMLEPEHAAAPGHLRRVFHAHAASVRLGEVHQDPHRWLPPYGVAPLETVDDSAEPLRLAVLDTCVDGFAGLETLAQAADALDRLVGLLRTGGAHLWNRFVIDAEYLARLEGSIIPQLRTSAMSRRVLGRATLFSVLRSLLQAERVSFEPEPLTGMQVMGVLETRLLSFTRLYILDAVEDRLPSSSPYDPLLPDPLRHSVGLPDCRERDNVSAYNFRRLLMGAESAVILYQSGVQPGLFDSKSVRSRYVEELIWEREKLERRGKALIQPGEEPIAVVHFPASPIPPGVPDIPMTAPLAERLRTLLGGKGLSATSLDCWLTCPKKHFYRYVARLRPARTMDESGDMAAFGELVHQVLRDFLAPHLGREVDLSLLDPARLRREFETAFDADERLGQAAWNVRLALKATAGERLERFLKQGGPTHLLALEQQLSATLETRSLRIPLTGHLDRVDLREYGENAGPVVLDYKTGRVNAPRRGVWEDMDLWQRIEDCEPDDPDLLPDLRQALRSVQLPLYLHLCAESNLGAPLDAGWIGLGQDGRETLLFGDGWTMQEREDVVRNMIPRLLRCLAATMLDAGSFRAVTGDHCQWCDYRGPCGV